MSSNPTSAPGAQDLEQGHNASLQKEVDVNPDPALRYSHEHQHEHLHHGRTSLSGRKDEVMYSHGTTDQQKDFLAKPPQNYDTHKITEKGPIYDETDTGKGGMSPTRLSSEEEVPKRRTFGSFVSTIYRRFKIFFHLFFWLVWTAWWIVGLVLHRNRGWLIPFLLYLAITIRMITFWIPMSYAWNPVKKLWGMTAIPIYNAIPAKFHQPAAAAVTVATILVGTFASEEFGENTRASRGASVLGICVFLFVMYITSRNRRKINWHTVIGGMLTQFIIALFVLRTKAGYDIFDFISFLARSLLGFAKDGLTFLFGTEFANEPIFVVAVIPAIIFFVALIQLLYYIGFIQWFVIKFASFFFWTLRVSGAEAVVAAATPFIGQGESAMLVKPFVPHMTKAELHQVMTCGFATIAGSVLVAYIGLGLNAQALISSCIMSIPASLAMSKLRYPEEEETLTSGRVVIPDDDEDKASNFLHAFANGAWLGIKIAGMIVATLLCIISLVACINALLGWWGKYWGAIDTPITLELILGYLMYPFAWLLGVSRQDTLTVAKLIGEKIIYNEYYAFSNLNKIPTSGRGSITDRSRIIATYALCGFGNLGSLGTQIGVLSQLAPSRAGDVSALALSALFTGVVSTLSSAAVAGLVVTDQHYT